MYMSAHLSMSFLQVSYVVDVERDRDAYKLQCSKLEQECAALQQQLRDVQNNNSTNGSSGSIAGASDGASMDLLSGATSNSSSSDAALDLLDGSSASVLPTQTHQEGEGDLLGLMPMASPPPLLDSAPQSLLLPETSVDESAAATSAIVAAAEAKAAASAQQVRNYIQSFTIPLKTMLHSCQML